MKAIKEGPKRVPIQCGAAESMPGKAIIDETICTGCGY